MGHVRLGIHQRENCINHDQELCDPEQDDGLADLGWGICLEHLLILCGQNSLSKQRVHLLCSELEIRHVRRFGHMRFNE